MIARMFRSAASRMVLVAVGLLAYAALSLAFDGRLAWWGHGLAPAEVRFAKDISNFGLSGSMVALIGLALAAGLFARRRRDDPWLTLAGTALVERASYLLAVLATEGLVVQVTKHLVGRARPRYIEMMGTYHFEPFSMKNSLASFPSGHSANVFGMAVALSLMAPRLRIPLFLVAITIALSRIPAQQHFLSDVVAGSALGVVTALLLARAFARRSRCFSMVEGTLRLRAPGALAALIRRKRSA